MKRILLLIIAAAVAAYAGWYYWNFSQQASSAPVSAFLPRGTIFLAHMPDFGRTRDEWRRSDIYQLYREPAVQEVVDDGSCKSQAGAQGFDITVTRVFKSLDSGAELKRENFKTHYAAEPIIRCIAPPAGAPAPDGSTPAASTGSGG